MRSLPHKPSAASIKESKARILEYLEGAAECREEKLQEGSSGFFYHLADQWVLRGSIEYFEEAQSSDVVDAIRSGVQEFCTAIELGYQPKPWDVWNYTLYAIAIGDWPSAHFLASMPEELWIDYQNESLYWLMMAAKAVIALLRNDPMEEERWTTALHDMVFDRPLPSGFKEDTEEIQNLQRLLEAIRKGDGSRFNSLLSERMNLRAKSFLRYSSSSPLGFLDLQGLGLCRLAQGRSISVTVRHVYLPLALALE